MPYLVTEPELEARLIEVRQSPKFALVKARYEAMLTKLGNVDGDEVLALALIAIDE